MSVQMRALEHPSSSSGTPPTIPASPEERFDVTRLRDNFGALTGAHDGLEKLRELAIEMAVRGLLADGVDRSSWKRVLLSDVVADFQNGIAKRRGDTGTPIPVLRLADIDRGSRIRKEGLREITLTAVEQEKYRVRRGDILVIRVNGSADLVGRFVPCDVDREWAYSDHLIRVRPRADLVDTEFVCTLARSAAARAHVEANTVTTAGQRTINQGGLGSLPLLLPPLAEQKRIVARVDQLMVLIDDLEAKQTKKRDLSTRFTKASLEALTTADSPEAFSTGWERVAENFTSVVDRSDDIVEMRSAILALAVRGKLVASDPDDEPANRVADRIRKRRGLTDARDTDGVVPPFDLPRGWAWSSLVDLGEFGRGRSKHRPRNDAMLFRNGKYPMIQTGDVARANGLVTTYSALYGDEGLAQSRLWPKGTLCITIAANIADSSILGFDACFPDSVVGFVPDPELGDAKYFDLFLRTAKQRIEDFAPATAQKNVNLEILSKVLVPLPPKAEMQRIVAKVEHMMKLCDDLEANLRRAEDRAAKLVEAVVQEMVA